MVMFERIYIPPIEQVVVNEDSAMWPMTAIQLNMYTDLYSVQDVTNFYGEWQSVHLFSANLHNYFLTLIVCSIFISVTVM